MNPTEPIDDHSGADKAALEAHVHELAPGRVRRFFHNWMAAVRDEEARRDGACRETHRETGLEFD